MICLVVFHKEITYFNSCNLAFSNEIALQTVTHTHWRNRMSNILTRAIESTLKHHGNSTIMKIEF